MKPTGMKKGKFIKRLIQNLGLLLIIAIILFLVFPDMMRQVFQLFGGLFAPALIVILIVVAAVPRR